MDNTNTCRACGENGLHAEDLHEDTGVCIMCMEDYHRVKAVLDDRDLAKTPSGEVGKGNAEVSADHHCYDLDVWDAGSTDVRKALAALIKEN